MVTIQRLCENFEPDPFIKIGVILKTNKPSPMKPSLVRVKIEVLENETEAGQDILAA